jgi:pimeloyl-ACP methyl ester carboxylesterase
MTPVPYRRGSVRSADGTVLGYRELGRGPGLIVLHGGMLAAQSMMKLAEALSGDFTAYVPDRRGRGASGPHGPDYGVAREVEDVQALLAGTGEGQAFGLSSGALVTLRTALVTPALKRIALYEPPLSVRGSVPTEWLARFDREIAAGRVPAALATAMKGMDVDPLFSRVPRPVLAPMMALALRFQRTPEGDVPIAGLVPSQHYDFALIRELADTQRDYAAVSSEVLLLGGGKSPAYLKDALDELSAVLPHARRVTFPRLDHSAPSDEGDPARVARELLEFFTG